MNRKAPDFRPCSIQVTAISHGLTSAGEALLHPNKEYEYNGSGNEFREVSGNIGGREAFSHVEGPENPIYVTKQFWMMAR